MIIHANVFSYLIALAAAIILSLVLRLPLLPDKHMRHSWTISAVFPTAVLAVGFYAMVYELGYQGYIVALITGIITALFAKFILEKVVPVPELEESHEWNFRNSNCCCYLLVELRPDRHLDGTSRSTWS